MANKKTKLPFKGTKEQEEQLRSFIRALPDKDSAVITVLQKAQEIYGYLPEEVQLIVADELGVSPAEVYGVSTFYSQASRAASARRTGSSLWRHAAASAPADWRPS